MADPVSAISTYMTAAATAVAAGDYATAIVQALAAQALVVGLPSQMSKGQGGGGTQSMGWNFEAISKFILDVRRQQGASVGVQVAPMFTRPPHSYGGRYW